MAGVTMRLRPLNKLPNKASCKRSRAGGLSALSCRGAAATLRRIAASRAAQHTCFAGRLMSETTPAVRRFAPQLTKRGTCSSSSSKHSFSHAGRVILKTTQGAVVGASWMLAHSRTTAESTPSNAARRIACKH
eukprot:6635432-Prymnesium_polylepis.2